MRRLNVFLVLIGMSLSIPAFAQFKGEAEAGAIIVSGSKDSESYNSKANASYTVGANVYNIFGRWLKTNSEGVESARNWEAGVRYERALSEHFSFYLGHKAESDIYNGYVQRDSSDAGLKYTIIKSDTLTWAAEAGYRYQKYLATTGDITNDNMGRLYTEVNKTLDQTLSVKYWAEYLPNFTESEAYQANTEASLNIMLNSVFSLKLAYLLQYQNLPPAGAEYTTTTTTMNLVAKF